MANISSPPQLPLSFIEEYCGNALINVAIAFTIVETVFVSMRFLARRAGNIKLAGDDVLIVVALLLCLGINGVAIAMVQYAGVGHHEVVVYAEHPWYIILWAKFLVVESFLYLVVAAIPKLAILMIYLKVFPTTVVQRLCYAVGGFMILYMGLICLAIGFACRPLAFFWDKTIDGTCVDIKALYQWASFPNIITDIAMLILPLPMIWRLNLARHVKIGLSFTFLTGSVGLVASCLRFAEFSRINPLEDGPWTSVTLMIWTIIEPGAYLIAACLPTLRPLFNKTRKTNRGTVGSSGKRGSDVSAVQETASHKIPAVERSTTPAEGLPMDDIEKFATVSYKIDRNIVQEK